jgi:glucose/arabinose dehydrogenase
VRRGFSVLNSKFPILNSQFFLLALCAALWSQPLPDNVTYRNYFGTMTFNRPLLFAQYPGEDSAYVVLEQVGKIRTVERRNAIWAKTDSAVLQVPVVTATTGGKCATAQARATSTGITTGYYESRGLLGFAFHPQFRLNRKYYVSYVTVRDSSGATHERSIVAERIADSTLRPKTADPERVLLDFCQPGWDHKGGHIGFGPDGMLYFSTGDGGNQDLWNSPNNPSLRRDTWLGKVLRIDVDGTPDPGKAYRVPPDNPFVDSTGFRPEVWAWGLRNPWKWQFHPRTGDMWLGNVGYTNRDNIYRMRKGAYLGWPVWEGNHCSSSGNLSGQCAATAAVVLRPALDLLHNTDARSVTGGVFFLGDSAAPYHGAYFFGDYIYNWVRVARFDPAADTVLEYRELGSITNVASFDRDSLGRIFALSLGTGSVSANTGVVYILESPSFAAPVGVRAAAPRRGPQPPLAEILANPERYDLRGLDGKVISGVPSGAFVVRDRTMGTKILMTRVGEVVGSR